MPVREHDESETPSGVILMTGDIPGAERSKRKFPLTQETLAILAVGVTLLTTALVTTARIESRIDQIRVEAREDRAEALALREAHRLEARAAREAHRLEAREALDRQREALDRQIEAQRAEGREYREAFARQIAALTRGQAHLNGLVEGLQAVEVRPESAVEPASGG